MKLPLPSSCCPVNREKNEKNPNRKKMFYNYLTLRFTKDVLVFRFIFMCLPFLLRIKTFIKILLLLEC